jgi:hypothetical protein
MQALGIHLAQGFVFGPLVALPGREQLEFPEGLPDIGLPVTQAAP